MVIASSVPQVTQATYELPSYQIIKAANEPIDTKRGFIYPTPIVKINQSYGLFHPGVDLGGKIGDPIHAAMSGRVMLVDHLKFGYGNYIVITHGGNTATLYAHLSKILVTVGQDVDQSTVIGEMGITGHTTGPHLHFEVIENGYRINPFSVLPKTI